MNRNSILSLVKNTVQVQGGLMNLFSGQSALQHEFGYNLGRFMSKLKKKIPIRVTRYFTLISSWFQIWKQQQDYQQEHKYLHSKMPGKYQWHFQVWFYNYSSLTHQIGCIRWPRTHISVLMKLQGFIELTLNWCNIIFNRYKTKQQMLIPILH